MLKVYFRSKLLAILKIVEHWKMNIFVREIVKRMYTIFKVVNNSNNMFLGKYNKIYKI